jgi:hypothetical protein
MKSKFAQELEVKRQARMERSGRRSTVGMQGGQGGRKGSAVDDMGEEKRVESV